MVKVSLGVLFYCGFEGVSLFGPFPVQRKVRLPCAPLLGMGLFSLIGEKVLKPDQQEGSKFAAVRLRHPQMFARQEPCEEALGQVLGVMGTIALPAHEAI